MTPDVPVSSDALAPVFTALANLHAAKNKVYGSSWKKHGELFSIVPNIARKMDRLEITGWGGETGTPDETPLDTVADVTLYAVLYLSWLQDLVQHGNLSEVEQVLVVLLMLRRKIQGSLRYQVMALRPQTACPELATDAFESLERLFSKGLPVAGIEGAHGRLRSATDIAAAGLVFLAYLARTRPAAFQAWASQWGPKDEDQE